MDLAFCPIAIQTPEIQPKQLSKFMKSRGSLHYTGCWYEAPLCGRLEDPKMLMDPVMRDKAWSRRHQVSGVPEVCWAPECDELLPDLKESLAKLPFISLNYCNLLLQVKDVPAHFDLDHRFNEAPQKKEPSLEPASYKWLLSEHQLQSFFIQRQKEQKSGLQYIRLPAGHSFFAITESEFVHGASYHPGSEKYILSIFGVLDKDRHLNLIKKSQNRFADFAIFL